MTTYTKQTDVRKQVNAALELSASAFKIYGKKSLKDRADFMRAIASEISLSETKLIAIASQETHLDAARLGVEFRRTIFQLTSYASACEEGTWLDIRIDTAEPYRNPPRPDIRKMLMPLGPVVVFGASNFPFAYSTAGGDTACALAAGCTVIVKAHPAHARTSEMVSDCIKKAAKRCGLPEGVFLHISDDGFEAGVSLVEHPLTCAVGFTGSYEGGKALFDLAAKRTIPIPVFAEMGSVNPVFLFPEKLKSDAAYFAGIFATSVTQSSGQFCTKPGVLVAVKGEGLDQFKNILANAIKKVPPALMLHKGITENFLTKRTKAMASPGVELIAATEIENKDAGIPTLTGVDVETFINLPLLQHEVFGPFTILVECNHVDDMHRVANVLEGQLTCSVVSTSEELMTSKGLLEILMSKCGRIIFNGVPTGVEVVLSMQHGGPFPATTDSRFSAVGADGIKRFARPFCFQNCENQFFPEELKNENPLGVWRTVNNELSRKPIIQD